MDLDFAADRNLRELSGEEAWKAAQAKRLFENKDVLVEMHRGIALDKVENSNPQSTPQVLPSFEEYTPPVTSPKEVEENLGTPIEKSVQYGVSNGLDTVYWGFLGVGTTFDIFQNIILIPYLEYGVLSPLDTAYCSLIFCGLCLKRVISYGINVLNWRKNKKEKTLIFKVDFEKAYDSLCWDFLQEVMHKMGFGSKWCKWIRGCLQSSMASVLVNGSPTNEFEIKRGLRQGDPLSPFLFFIAMEGLHMLMENAMNVSRIKGIEIDRSDIVLSHLFYADDVIFIGEWSEENVSNIVMLLQCFYLVSGLKINLSKCSLLGIGVQEAEVKGVADGVGCTAGTLPFMYLGVPIGNKMSKVNDWKDLIDKFKKGFLIRRLKLSRLEVQKWMRENLRGYNGGKLWLARSMVDWGYEAFMGSIGYLLFKWKWRFLNSPLALWERIIKSLFGNDGGFAGISSSRRGGSVGNGRATRFWEDFWIGTRPLKDLFPRVWALDEESESMVCDRIHLMRDGSWLRHCPRGGVEREQWNALISLVQTHIVSDHMDRWLWSADGSGVFFSVYGESFD
ncbi:RNA-directed DNA polymerase, eukaryota [Tanacetum coccineum]